MQIFTLEKLKEDGVFKDREKLDYTFLSCLTVMGKDYKAFPFITKLKSILDEEEFNNFKYVYLQNVKLE